MDELYEAYQTRKKLIAAMKKINDQPSVSRRDAATHRELERKAEEVTERIAELEAARPDDGFDPRSIIAGATARTPGARANTIMGNGSTGTEERIALTREERSPTT